MVVLKNYYFDARVRRYAESLIKNGVKVDVLCLQDDDLDIVIANTDNLRVFTIPLHHFQGGRARYLYEISLAFLLFTIKLLGLHFKNRYQVIHVHNMPDLLLFSAIIPKMMGARIILDIHDPMPEVYISKYGQFASPLVVRILALQEKLSCLIANAIVSANSHFKENLVIRGVPADKITVVNNIPNSDIFNRGAYQEERLAIKKQFTLIFPGTIAPRYGLEVPIRALQQLATKIPEIRLLIIGPHSQYKDELIKLAEQIGVSTFILFKPSIPVGEVPRQIALADVGIYPALPDPHMSIATPGKILEFAVMGIPIVSSRLRIVEDFFTDAGVSFFEPGNVDKFAECIIDLYENPPRREELIQNADRIFVQTQSWAQELKKYLDLLNTLLPRTGLKDGVVQTH